MTRIAKIGVTMIAAALMYGCQTAQQQSRNQSANLDLIGSWRASVQFETGPYSEIKDLNFMYIFNSDGTMLESSNYDAAPPVPPAYGIWRSLGEHQFEAKYEFYVTRVPDTSEHLPAGTGWLPGGFGRLVDTISIESDGHSFSSRTHLTMYNTGDSVTGDDIAVGHGTKMRF